MRVTFFWRQLFFGASNIWRRFIGVNVFLTCQFPGVNFSAPEFWRQLFGVNFLTRLGAKGSTIAAWAAAAVIDRAVRQRRGCHQHMQAAAGISTSSTSRLKSSRRNISRNKNSRVEYYRKSADSQGYIDISAGTRRSIDKKRPSRGTGPKGTTP